MTEKKGFDSTAQLDLPKVILAVGGPGALVRAVKNAAELLGIKMLSAELKDMATLAAGTRPFAIVVSANLHAYDSEEFEALARDVGAKLLVIDVDTANRDLLDAEVATRARLAFRSSEH